MLGFSVGDLHDMEPIVRSYKNAIKSAEPIGAFVNDKFPHPESVPYWPELIPDFDVATIGAMADIGAVICGDPDQALEQCKRCESAAADQLVFGVGCATKADTLEMIELMGKHVIPKVDTDPVHRTTKMRNGA